jgi:ABC-type transport system substrate-binding protein
LWQRAYLLENRFSYRKLALVIIGCLILLVWTIFHIKAPGPALNVQIARAPDLLDPARTSSYEDKLINGALYEPLVTYDPEQHLCKGLLAESWDASRNGSVWTFYMRPGLRFSDGVPVTARDVKDSWERALDPRVGNCGYLLENVAGSDEWIAGGSKDVSGLVAVDQHTLQVVLKGPDWNFPIVVSSPSLAIVSRQAAARWGAAYGTTVDSVVGTGPFRLIAWSNGQVVLQRNAGYTGLRPQIKTLTFLTVNSPQETIGLYENGKLDLLTEASAQVISSLTARDGQNGFAVLRKPVLNLYFLGFNLKQPPFENSALRRAISLAVDGSTMAGQLLGSGARVLNGVLPPELAVDTQQYDPAKQGPGDALQALAGAGYPYGLGLPQLSYAYNDSTGNDGVAQLLQNQLDRIGVDLRCRKISWQSYEVAVRSGSYTLFRLGWDADYADPENLLYFNFDSAERARGNLTGYDSTRFDALLQQARDEQNPSRRQEIYQKAEQVLMADAPIIPLFQQVALFGVRKGVTGLNVDLLGRVDFDQLKKSAE